MSLFRHDPRELRNSARHELHYLAHIEPGENAPVVNCIICDISDGGAKLTIGSNDVPDEFTLLFRRRCRVIRRSDGQVGVQFVQVQRAEASQAPGKAFDRVV